MKLEYKIEMKLIHVTDKGRDTTMYKDIVAEFRGVDKGDVLVDYAAIVDNVYLSRMFDSVWVLSATDEELEDHRGTLLNALKTIDYELVKRSKEVK